MMATSSLKRTVLAPARTLRWFARRVAALTRSQATNLARWIAGKPVALIGHGSMTLDRDDLRIARDWLRRPQDWRDPAPVLAFEEAFAAFNASANAFAFSAGRAALSACLEALDIGADDEVILPGYTCVVVPNAMIYRGIRPVYADIELDTYGLDAAGLARLVTPRTRAVLLHHLYGLVSRDYEAIVGFARQRGLAVIEDCAHSTGATWRGRPVGNLGDVAFYSSEQSKVFNTVMGGVAVTNDATMAERLARIQHRVGNQAIELTRRLLRNVPMLYYTYKSPHRWLARDLVELFSAQHRLVSTPALEEQGGKPTGYGAAMAPPIAAIGLNQLAKIAGYNHRRRAAAARWDTWALARGLTPPLVIPDSVPVFLRYPVMVSPSKKLDRRWAADDLGVDLGVWFRTQIHPVVRSVAGCPNAERAVAGCVNLPCLD
jgi:perosamine synthetase